MGKMLFANASKAVQAMVSAAEFLAGADWPDLPAAVKGECLKGMEAAEAILTVARTGAITAFDGAGDFELDGYGSGSQWLIHVTGIDKGASAEHRGWRRHQREHPRILQAMRRRVLSKSWAKAVMRQTSRIPESHRDEADKIIVRAARHGVGLAGLLWLAAEILTRTIEPDKDMDTDYPGYGLILQTTLDGASVLHGDLSPECTAALQAVLRGLSAKSSKEDLRTPSERMHDGLQDACMRLLGSDLLPPKNGHAVQAIVHIGLADMLLLEGGSELAKAWTERLAAQWAGQRAAALAAGGDDAAWICGPAAAGITCDAALFPLVTGHPDLTSLGDLVRLCVELDGYLHTSGSDTDEDPSGSGSDFADATDDDPDADADEGAEPEWTADRGANQDRRRELMQQVIGKCVELLSGEPGLASFLRRNLLGTIGLGGTSLPLDVGDTDEIPPWIRRAVTTRDQRCCWPGGCDQPAAATQPHHVIHRAHHGATKVENLKLLCLFHHHVVVHRWGWAFKVHGDGSTEATAPDGRTYRSGSRPPPPRPG